MTKAVSSVRRSVSEIFFNPATVRAMRRASAVGSNNNGNNNEAESEKDNVERRVWSQLAELSNIEEDNRLRTEEEMDAEAEVLAAVWRGLRAPQLLRLCVDAEQQRRVRIVAEYNLWHMQWQKRRMHAAADEL
jgi:hypothetical protein